MPQNQSYVCEFPDQFVSIRGSNIHYVDIGKGAPIVFLHGMPTFSFIWRNIMPVLAPYARCIAPDLIGMGFSDKPDITYSIFDHIAYIEEFLTTLDLLPCTLVMHDWGSVVGLAIASRNPDKITAVAFFESYLRPITNRNMLSLPFQHVAAYLSRPGMAYRAIVEENYLLTKFLQSSAICHLNDEVLSMYQRPFLTPESRRPLWQYIQELSFGDCSDEVADLIQKYSDWLKASTIPKLMLYGMPGFITTMDTVQWAKNNLPNLQLEALEQVLHMAQESEPALFSEKLQNWYLEKVLEIRPNSIPQNLHTQSVQEKRFGGNHQS